MLPQPFRTIGKHSAAHSGTVGILSRRIRLLRIGFGVYTATLRLPLREHMPNETDGKASPILLINDPERFPKLAKLYRQPFREASGL